MLAKLTLTSLSPSAWLNIVTVSHFISELPFYCPPAITPIWEFTSHALWYSPLGALSGLRISHFSCRQSIVLTISLDQPVQYGNGWPSGQYYISLVMSATTWALTAITSQNSSIVILTVSFTYDIQGMVTVDVIERVYVQLIRCKNTILRFSSIWFTFTPICIKQMS